jgi:hypothetical protein
MQATRLLIVGAGPSGLGAAHRCLELGIDDWLVVDQASTAGGLAGSVLDEHGFTWDMGGHVQFSHYQSFDDYMVRALGSDGCCIISAKAGSGWQTGSSLIRSKTIFTASRPTCAGNAFRDCCRRMRIVLLRSQPISKIGSGELSVPVWPRCFSTPTTSKSGLIRLK